MSASLDMNDRMRAWFEVALEEEPGALAGVALNDIMRRYLEIADSPATNLQDAIAADADWFGLGGDALYVFFEPVE